MITLKGLKKEVEWLDYSVFNRLVQIKRYRKELRGIIGQDESSSVGMVLFGAYAIREPEQYEQKLKAFADSLPDPVTAEAIKPRLAEIQQLFDDHIYIEDNRETPEQAEERRKKNEEATEQRQTEDQERKQIINLKGEGQVDVPGDRMAVSIGAYFDNSDMMTDYFASHAHLDGDYVITTVRKGARTEAMIRDVIAKIPELAKLTWEWNVEEYSGGHGTYMQSEAVGTVKKKAYNGRDEVSYHFEISYDKGHETLRMQKARFYFDVPVSSGPSGSSPISGGGVHVSRNEEKGGVEIKFDEKPNYDTIAQVKGAGFRWSKFQKLWWARFTEGRWSFAQELAGKCEAKAEAGERGEDAGIGAMIEAEQEAGIERFEMQLAD